MANWYALPSLREVIEKLKAKKIDIASATSDEINEALDPLGVSMDSKVLLDYNSDQGEQAERSDHERSRAV